MKGKSRDRLSIWGCYFHVIKLHCMLYIYLPSCLRVFAQFVCINLIYFVIKLYRNSKEHAYYIEGLLFAWQHSLYVFCLSALNNFLIWATVVWLKWMIEMKGKWNTILSYCGVCVCWQYLYKFTELRSLDPAVLYDPLTSIILKGTVPRTPTSTLRDVIWSLSWILYGHIMPLTATLIIISFS